MPLWRSQWAVFGTHALKHWITAAGSATTSFHDGWRSRSCLGLMIYKWCLLCCNDLSPNEFLLWKGFSAFVNRSKVQYHWRAPTSAWFWVIYVMKALMHGQLWVSTTWTMSPRALETLSQLKSHWDTVTDNLVGKSQTNHTDGLLILDCGSIQEQ